MKKQIIAGSEFVNLIEFRSLAPSAQIEHATGGVEQIAFAGGRSAVVLLRPPTRKRPERFLSGSIDPATHSSAQRLVLFVR